MKRRTIIVLAVGVVIIGGLGVAAWPWLTFAGAKPSRDFRAEFSALASGASGITPVQGRAAWDDYQRVLAAQRAAYIRAFGTIAKDADGNESYNATIELQGWGAGEPGDDAKYRALLAAMDAEGMGEALDRLSEHPAFERPLPPGLITNVLMPDLGQSRALFRALRLRASDAKAAPEERLAAIRRSAELGRLIGREPIAISWLVGTAISAGAAEEAQRLAASGAISPAQARALAAEFGEPTVLPAVMAIRGETLFGLDSIQSTLGTAPLAPFNREANMVRYAALMGRYEAWAATPLHERDPAVPVSESEIMSKMYPTIGILMPAVQNMVSWRDAWEVQRRGTVVVLHIEAYAREHGALPASLDALGLDAEALRDPCTDRPWGYKPLATPDAAGRRYLLYSIGLDRVDNQGFEDPTKRNGALREGSKQDMVVGGPVPETPPTGGR